MTGKTPKKTQNFFTSYYYTTFLSISKLWCSRNSHILKDMNMFKPTDATSVDDYISQIPEPRKTDIITLHEILQKIMAEEQPSLVYSMIAYGIFHYKSKSGREGDWPLVALASQKNYISVYVCAVDDNKKYIAENYKDALPGASIGKSCIRFKRLADIDIHVLQEIVEKAKNLTPSF